MRNSTGLGRMLFKVAAMGLMLLAFILVHIWVRTQFVTESFRLASLRKELRELEASRALEQVELDELLDPRNLERLNTKKSWGLREAQPEQILYVPQKEQDTL